MICKDCKWYENTVRSLLWDKLKTVDFNTPANNEIEWIGIVIPVIRSWIMKDSQLTRWIAHLVGDRHEMDWRLWLDSHRQKVWKIFSWPNTISGDLAPAALNVWICLIRFLHCTYRSRLCACMLLHEMNKWIKSRMSLDKHKRYIFWKYEDSWE